MSAVTLTIDPGDTQARTLPFGLVDAVAQVLKVYGLDLRAMPQGRGLVLLIMALGRVVDRTPQRFGGLAPDDGDDGGPSWIDTGSGPGWSPPDSPDDRTEP